MWKVGRGDDIDSDESNNVLNASIMDAVRIKVKLTSVTPYRVLTRDKASAFNRPPKGVFEVMTRSRACTTFNTTTWECIGYNGHAQAHPDQVAVVEDRIIRCVDKHEYMDSARSAWSPAVPMDLLCCTHLARPATNNDA